MDYTFITQLLQILANIKVHHWSTTTYSTHIASDSLHAKLSELTDLFIETYLGANDARPEFTDDNSTILINKQVNLPEIAKWLEVDLMRVAGNNLALRHIVEEMCTTIQQTRYLFTFHR